MAFTITKDGLPAGCIDSTNLKSNSGIVTSVNNTVPDSNGNVVVQAGVTSVNGKTGAITPEQTGCLPLSGGTINGTINTTNNITLIRRGTDGNIFICGSDTWRTGAGIDLYGKDHAIKGGQAVIYAQDGTNRPALELKPDGTAKWNGKEVERVNSSGDSWVRYESGLQIVFNHYTHSTGSTHSTVTFPVAFSSDPRVTISTSTAYGLRVTSITKTGFNTSANISETIALDYVAIGRWK